MSNEALIDGQGQAGGAPMIGPGQAMPPQGSAAVGAAALCSIGISFNGLNSLLGSIIVGGVGVGALMLMLALWPAPCRFWRHVWPVLLLVAGAALWAAMPIWLQGFGDGTAVAPDLARPALLGLAGYVAALLCGARAGERRRNLGTGIDALIAFGCLNALVGLALRSWQDVLPFDLWHGRHDGRFTGTVSNANVAGTYFGMLAMLAMARMLAARPAGGFAGDRSVRALRRFAAYAVALALMLGACLITGSRSAGTATVVGLGVLVLWRALRRRGGSGWLGLAILGGLIVLTMGLGLSELLLDRLAIASSEMALRVLMWRHYADLVSAAPWHGYGLGAFPALNAQALTDPRLAQALWMVNSAHNLLLQLLLQGGWPYVALIMAAAVWVGAGMLRRGIDLHWQHGMDGAVAAVLLVLACSMIDIALDVPAIVSVTLFLAGMVWAPGRHPSPHPNVAPRTSGA